MRGRAGARAGRGGGGVDPAAGAGEFYGAQCAVAAAAEGDSDVSAAQNAATDGGRTAVAGGDQAVCGAGQRGGSGASADCGKRVGERGAGGRRGAGVACGAEAAAGVSPTGGAKSRGASVFEGGRGARGAGGRSVQLCGGEAVNSGQ